MQYTVFELKQTIVGTYYFIHNIYSWKQIYFADLHNLK